MKIGRKRLQERDNGLVVEGGGEPKKVPAIGAGIAIALTRALGLAVGGRVVVTEYGNVIYTAVREETGSVIYEGNIA